MDRLAANVMRSLQTREQEIAEESIQPKFQSPWAPTFEPPPPLPESPASKLKGAFASVSENSIQRQCAECAKEMVEQKKEKRKEIDEIGIQTKLTVGAPGDAYEQEADQVAAQVMSMPDNSPHVQKYSEANYTNEIWQRAQSIQPVVQRVVDPSVEMGEMIQRAHQMGRNQPSSLEANDPHEIWKRAHSIKPVVQRVVDPRVEMGQMVQRAHQMGRNQASSLEANNPNEIWQRAQSIKPVVQRVVDPSVEMGQMVQRAHQMGGNQASGDLESRLNASKGGGSPLSENVRGFMEPRFGADFSGVRVHTGGEAVQMNQELGAQAFTHGSDVYFGQGKQPGNNELTAHELTHVVQQSGGVMRSPVPQQQLLQNTLMGVFSNEHGELLNKPANVGAIQRKLIIAGEDMATKYPFLGKRTLQESGNKLYENMLSDERVCADQTLLSALRSNAEPIKVQLTKWMENKPGKRDSKNPHKSHPLYGRKQQNRSYANFYDLARAVLGWVESKWMRHQEKILANQIYENAPLQAALNGLLVKLYFKIHNLESEGLVDSTRQRDILTELQSGLSMATGRFTPAEHKWVEDAGGQQTRLGHYQRYHRETARRDSKSDVDHRVPDNQLLVLQNPTAYSLKDKIILLHDLMEYFGIHQSWNPKTKGEGLLPVETRDETMVTTGVDESGERTASVSMSDGTRDDKKRARGMGITTASRDEDAPNTILARYLKLPVWAGQSMTTVRMMKLAQWVGATNLEKSALAMSIFAYWRKDYDHRSDFAYHTLFEVLDVAKNFGVTYKMQPNYHVIPSINIQDVLKEAEQKYQELVVITKQLATRTNELNIGEPLKRQIGQLFEEINNMNSEVNIAYRIASDNTKSEEERNRSLNLVVISLENAVEKQKHISTILNRIPIPMDLD
jgi:hypothetical protein